MTADTSPVEPVPEPVASIERRASSERRGRERRRGNSRINMTAPRRSLLQTIALSAAGICGALAGLGFATGLVMEHMYWPNILAALSCTAFALLAFILGCIEQRLVEIRLELMMANGGARQADRRQGDRRS